MLQTVINISNNTMHFLLEEFITQVRILFGVKFVKYNLKYSPTVTFLIVNLFHQNPSSGSQSEMDKQMVRQTQSAHAHYTSNT